MNLTHTIHDGRRLMMRLLNRSAYEMLRDRRVGSTSKDYYRPFDETRSIFVHIPKTGGVRSAIVSTEIVPASRKHKDLSDRVSGGGLLHLLQVHLVRNPWDRLYSAYRYHSSPSMVEGHDLAWIEKNMSTRAGMMHSVISQVRDFEDFVLNYLARPNVRSFVHFRTQQSFLRNRVTGKIGVDFVGRFERLDEDFATVARRIGKDAVLPHLNRSGISGQYREAYSAKMREIVGKIYESDARLFGYAF